MILTQPKGYIKEKSGMTFGENVKRIRLNKASTLLRNGNMTVENISAAGLRQNQDKRALYDRWKKPGDVAKFKSISLTETTPISSRFVMDENTFSCESISVNYETHGKWLKHIGVSTLTLSASTSDIFRISSVKNERGLDYPFQRSVNFSLGVRF
mgnify:CR=1 FL=1